MADMTNESATTPPQEQLSYLWDQYTYHHGLCWKAVYKIVAVVIVLAVLPYAKLDLTKPLGYWMLVPPIIGTLFAFFGVFVVNNELRLFANAKVAHHSVQKRFHSRVLTESDLAKMTVNDYEASKSTSRPPDFLGRAMQFLRGVHAKMKGPRWTLFDIYVHLLIIALLLLSLGNTVFLAFSWIPSRAVQHVVRPECG
jgi:hypothetical protein